MNDKIRIKADIERLSGYIADFEKGNLQVPAFQRDFLWTNEQKLELFDSIKKGYPIFLWTVDERNRLEWALDKKPYGIISDEPIFTKQLRYERK